FVLESPEGRKRRNRDEGGLSRFEDPLDLGGRAGVVVHVFDDVGGQNQIESVIEKPSESVMHPPARRRHCEAEGRNDLVVLAGGLLEPPFHPPQGQRDDSGPPGLVMTASAGSRRTHLRPSSVSPS